MKFDGQYILELFAIRSALILLVGLCLGTLLRKRNPAGSKLALRCSLATSLLCVILPTSLTSSPRPALNVAPSAYREARTDLTDSPDRETSKTEREASVAASLPNERHSLAVQPASSVQPEPFSEPGRLSNLHMSSVDWWLLGMGFCMALNGFGMMVLSVIRIHGRALHDPRLNEFLEGEIRRLGIKCPSIKTSPRLDIPCVAGIFAPTIFIPLKVLENLEAADLQVLVRHELVHVRNQDCLWNLISRFVASVLWFNPLVWIVAKQLSLVTEEVCDVGVIENGSSKSAYASSLVSIAQKIHAKSLSGRFGLGIFENESSLGKRLHLILNAKGIISSRPNWGSKFAAYSGTAFAAVLGGLAVMGITQRQIRVVPYFNAKTPLNTDPRAEAYLTKTLDLPDSFTSLRETGTFQSGVWQEVYRLTMLTPNGPAKIEVLHSKEVHAKQIFVEGNRDILVPKSTQDKILEIEHPVSRTVAENRVSPVPGRSFGLQTMLFLAKSKFRDHRFRFFSPGYSTAVFGPEISYEGRPAVTVLIQLNPHMRDGLGHRFIIDKEDHLVRELDWKSAKHPQYQPLEVFSDIEVNVPFERKDVTFQPLPNLAVVVKRDRFVPQELPKPQGNVPRVPTSLENAIDDANFRSNSRKFRDRQELTEVDPGDPKRTVRRYTRTLTATVQNYDAKATLIDQDNPANSGSLWSDGSYLWVQRKENRSKFLELVSDSEARNCFGGLNSEVECPAGMSIISPFRQYLLSGRLSAAYPSRLDGKAVDCLAYVFRPNEKRVLTVDHITHILRRVVTEDGDPKGKSVYSRSVEDFDLSPSNKSYPDSAYAFHPGPNMEEVDQAADLR